MWSIYYLLYNTPNKHVCLSVPSVGWGRIFSGTTQWRFNQLTQQIHVLNKFVNGLFDTCSLVIIFSLQSFTRSSSSTAKAGKLITLKTEAAISYGEKRPLKGLGQPHRPIFLFKREFGYYILFGAGRNKGNHCETTTDH